MKLLKNKIAVLLIFCALVPLFSQGSSPDISLKITKLSKISDSDYTIEYSVTYKGPDPEIFSSYSVYIPEETHIIEGIAENSAINERDFLFSRLNVDLNRNGSLEDIYTISANNGDIILNEVKLIPLYSKAGNRIIFTPLTSSAESALNRAGRSGRPFTLHSYDRTSGEIIIGLAPDNGDVPFKKLPNAQAVIEIIHDTENPDSINTSIDDARIFRGTTNEKIPDFTDDFHRPRITGTVHIPLKKGVSTGSFTVRNPEKPAFIRVTIYFAISARMSIFDRRTIMIN